jgi:hypothetical protein
MTRGNYVRAIINAIKKLQECGAVCEKEVILPSSCTTALKKNVMRVAVYLLTLIEEIDEW